MPTPLRSQAMHCKKTVGSCSTSKEAAAQQQHKHVGGMAITQIEYSRTLPMEEKNLQAPLRPFPAPLNPSSRGLKLPKCQHSSHRQRAARHLPYSIHGPSLVEAQLNDCIRSPPGPGSVPFWFSFRPTLPLMGLDGNSKQRVMSKMACDTYNPTSQAAASADHPELNSQAVRWAGQGVTTWHLARLPNLLT